MGNVIPLPADRRLGGMRARMMATPTHPALRWLVPGDAAGHRRGVDGAARCGKTELGEVAPAGAPACTDCETAMAGPVTG